MFLSRSSVHAIARVGPQFFAASTQNRAIFALPINHQIARRSPKEAAKRMSNSTIATAASSDASAAPLAPKKFSLLFYSYVPDIIERRDPFRAAHIQGAKEAVARGEMTMAGALAEPVDGAVFVFAPETSVEKIEEFAQKDPYVVNGLVTEWKVRPWMVVAG